MVTIEQGIGRGCWRRWSMVRMVKVVMAVIDTCTRFDWLVWLRTQDTVNNLPEERFGWWASALNRLANVPREDVVEEAGTFDDDPWTAQLLLLLLAATAAAAAATVANVADKCGCVWCKCCCCCNVCLEPVVFDDDDDEPGMTRYERNEGWVNRFNDLEMVLMMDQSANQVSMCHLLSTSTATVTVAPQYYRHFIYSWKKKF